jgi:transposase
MDHYAGIDVSLESSSVCVVDAPGRIVREAKIASEPEALTGWLKGLNCEIVRIGLEAGPLSQWLYGGMKQAGLAVERLETRHVRTAFKIMPVKTDRKDARGIAQLIRLGWFRPVHCKSLAAQESRALLGARKLLQTKLHDVEMSARGTLRGLGLKVGKTTPKTFESRVQELVAEPPTLLAVADALLRARTVLAEPFRKLDNQCHRAARANTDARRLTTAPGVGSIVALTFASAIDDPGRFKSSKSVGPLLSLTPRRYQSGETDVTGRISKSGDAMVRTALYEAANVILERLSGDAPLRKWGLARGDAQGQGGAGAQAGGDPAPDAGGWHRVRRRQGCRGGITEGGIDRFGRPVRAVRSKVPSPGRWIRSGRNRPSGGASLTARQLDWPADPYQTPSGGGHRADHGQKRDTSGRIGLEMLGHAVGDRLHPSRLFRVAVRATALTGTPPRRWPLATLDRGRTHRRRELPPGRENSASAEPENAEKDGYFAAPRLKGIDTGKPVTERPVDNYGASFQS